MDSNFEQRLLRALPSLSPEFLKKLRSGFEGDCTGHDWHHVLRVVRNAWKIQQSEGGDLLRVLPLALAHDLEDHKLEEKSVSLSEFSQELNYDRDLLERDVSKMGFCGAHGSDGDLDLEVQIVLDADRLDAIGAIGVSRCLAFGGARSQLIFHPEGEALEAKSREEYLKSCSSSIHHFYEKLLHITKHIHTKTGKLMAEARHRRLIEFLEGFLEEWYGEDEIPEELNLKRFSGDGE